ncbi:organomercurial lyase [Nocardia sp. NPDC059240]|uniref:organomercurial lyase n=1 Tax=Nocardia sp. NPDC059240 TaxID=3346786 RepID=UPI0036893D99
MKLEILQVPDCPNVAVLEDRIREALTGTALTIEIVHHVVTDHEEAAATGMTGSPTLLIDGRDPFATDGSVASLSCRLYPSEQGLDGAPAVDALRAAFGLSVGEGLRSWRAGARPADPTARAVHRVILRFFAEQGRPPATDELAEAVAGQGIPLAEVLRQLHDADAIRLDSAGAVASAYPFSATPTPHRVQIDGGRVVYAMCAVDALGLAAMLDTDIAVASVDPVTGAPIAVTVRRRRPLADPPSVVVFVAAQAAQGPSADTCCNYLNFFTDRSTAETWAADHPDIAGTILDLDRAHALGNQIFANQLRDIT